MLEKTSAGCGRQLIVTWEETYEPGPDRENLESIGGQDPAGRLPGHRSEERNDMRTAGEDGEGDSSHDFSSLKNLGGRWVDCVPQGRPILAQRGGPRKNRSVYESLEAPIRHRVESEANAAKS